MHFEQYKYALNEILPKALHAFWIKGGVCVNFVRSLFFFVNEITSLTMKPQLIALEKSQ